MKKKQVNEKPLEDIKYAASYIRVSTQDQLNGLSIEVQEKLCQRRAEEAGYKVSEVLDDGGISGHNDNRPGLHRLKELITTKKITAIVALSSERLFRNTRSHLDFMECVFTYGVHLLYVNGATPENNASSRMQDTVLASMNQFYRDQISDKVKGVLYEKAKMGYYPSRPPAGYMNVPNPDKNAERMAQKLVVPDPNTAPFIKEMFTLYATGNFNVYDLCDIMYEKGLRSRKDGKISPSRLHDMLRSRFYIGELVWGPISNIEGKHEPIIDEAAFNQVQMILTARNHHACRRRKYQWLLNGYLYCYKHDNRYTAEWHTIGNRRIAYYHCANKSGCGKYSEQVDLEAKVAEKFKDLEFSPAFIKEVIAEAKATFNEQRKGYDKKKQGLINQRTAFDRRRKVMEDKLFDGVIGDDDFKKNRAEVMAEIQRIEVKLSDLEKSREVRVDEAEQILRFTKNIYDAYQKASPDLKRHYLGFFWSRFEVSDKVIITSTPSLLFAELLKLKHAIFRRSETQKHKGLNRSNKVILGGLRLRMLNEVRTCI